MRHLEIAMDITVNPGVPPPGGHAAPQPTPDLRPSADSAALARSAPEALPLVLAPPQAAASVGPTTEAGKIARARLEGLETARPSTAPERVLKPFGISMLPDFEARQREAAAREAAEDSRQRSAEAAIDAETAAAAAAEDEARAEAVAREVDASTERAAAATARADQPAETAAPDTRES
ncbi:hypothetical protein [Pseudoroseicyclus sp. CXY001]|uniref:hypothetical protein n=1 Tax=Pseudoroseicyclus sp. CXY001 TaxID=3242492 RepID=UPI003570B09B